MGRRRKIPETVSIRIPTEPAELYETPVLYLLLPKAQAQAGEKLIEWIKENGRIYPDEITELAQGDIKERRRLDRALNKLIGLGLIGRGADGSYIFRKTNNLETRLIIIAEKIQHLKEGRK